MRGIKNLGSALLVFVAAACSDTGVTSPSELSTVRGRADVAAPAGSLLYIIAGNGQEGSPGTIVGPRDPAIIVRSGSTGLGINNVNVTFTCSGDCAVSNPSTVTNSSGVAATRWRLPTTPGTATLTATTAQGSVTFTAAVGGQVTPQAMSKVAGDNQTANAGTRVTIDPAVIVRDGSGNPIAGITVTFLPDFNGRVSNHTVVTDANGLASTSWTMPMANVSTSTLQAMANGGAVSQTFTANVGPVATTISKASDTRSNCSQDYGGSPCQSFGFAGPQDPVVLVTSNQNLPVAGVVVTFTPSGGAVSNPTCVTDNNGNCTTRWQFPAAPGTYTLTASIPSGATTTFTAVVNSGTPASITVVAGQNQPGTAGQLARPSAPAVQVKDANGNVLPGVVVTFTPSGNGAVSNPSATTDANGVASTEWRLPTSGPFTLEACVNGGGTCTTITNVATAIPSSMEIVAGNGQTGAAGSIVGPRDPAVIVKDANGNPIQGITVTFAPSGNGVVSSPTAVTDVNGIASTRWRLPTTPGTATLTASTTTNGNTLTRTFTATAQ